MKKGLFLLLTCLVCMMAQAQNDYEKYIDAAKKGDSKAQYQIGLCYVNSEGVTQDYAQAVSWWTKAANQGHAGAQYCLGVSYEHGNGVKQNYQQAISWYRKAAEQGHASAQCNLGVFYKKGIGIKKDEKQAISWYLKAANQGLIAAQYNLGNCYASGEGVEKDYTQAAFWFRKAAEQGDEDAKANLAKVEALLKEQQSSEESTYQKYITAAKQGDAEAQFIIGYCYQEGDGVTKDATQAVAWYRKAAEQGNAGAQYNLASCYYNGKGVAKDEAQAIAWLRKAAGQGFSLAEEKLKEMQSSEESEESMYQQYITAAKQGDAEAQFIIGCCYQDGDGVTKDVTQAVAWFRKAADQGYSDAQYNLATYYYNGEGVAQDYAQAVSWFRKAANQGDADAQCMLGYCYDMGNGVAQDYNQAIAWYRKAIDNGNEEAEDWLVKAEEKLRTQQADNDRNQKNLATIEWINFASTVNKKEYQLKVGVKSETKIEDVIITVNGSLSRGINTVKSDGYDQTINRTLTLREGDNTIVVSVRNADGLSSSEKTISCHTSSAAPTTKEKRVAFVVGNSHYSKTENNLKNPENDATDIAKKLKELGFEVILKTDATLRIMEDELSNFRNKAKDADVALFYYAGHGVQSKGANYILPTDIQDIKEESDLKWKCVNMERVLDVMEDSHSKLKLVVLDACRNDPLSRSWHRSAGSSGGLAQMNAPEGTILWYATSPGSVAQDGTGRNSPYTTALLKVLDIPNLEVVDIHKKVGAEVKYNTGQTQTPWMSSNFFDDFYFNKQ